MKKFPGIKSTVVGIVTVVWVETQITQGILAPLAPVTQQSIRCSDWAGMTSNFFIQHHIHEREF